MNIKIFISSLVHKIFMAAMTYKHNVFSLFQWGVSQQCCQKRNIPWVFFPFLSHAYTFIVNVKKISVITESLEIAQNCKNVGLKTGRKTFRFAEH